MTSDIKTWVSSRVPRPSRLLTKNGECRTNIMDNLAQQIADNMNSMVINAVTRVLGETSINRTLMDRLKVQVTGPEWSIILLDNEPLVAFGPIHIENNVDAAGIYVTARRHVRDFTQ